ncbi:MAG TPA: polyprenyl synthetase family protein [Actinomycetota bacterium]|nr:polyprenyl synthetase family protein [Actinomycetota bacterium]
MTLDRALDADASETVKTDVDAVLVDFLEESATDLGRIDERAPLLVHEISRLVAAGGERLRPAFCIWAYRSAGSPVAPGAPRQPIVRAAAAIELLHTMALIHDDLMDSATERRGVAASSPHLAGEALARGLRIDPARFGDDAALLTGDLAAVLADRLFLTSGFDPGAIVRALAPYHDMRIDMAAGQLLDIAGLASEPDLAGHAARLKGGSYTVEGPLMVGAALAGDHPDLRQALRAFGGPLGEAFQLRDDLIDAEAAHGSTREAVDELVSTARAALRAAARQITIDAEAVRALDALAARVAMT